MYRPILVSPAYLFAPRFSLRLLFLLNADNKRTDVVACCSIVFQVGTVAHGKSARKPASAINLFALGDFVRGGNFGAVKINLREKSIFVSAKALSDDRT